MPELDHIPYALQARSANIPAEDLRFEHYRASGPGGQKRNKTSSAVRVTHVPTGISATGTEFRSQLVNRKHAVERLCRLMTLKLRAPADTSSPQTLTQRAKKLAHLQILGFLLDVLAESDWSISKAADRIGDSTAQVVKFLKLDSDAWQTVNQNRQRIGLKALI